MSEGDLLNQPLSPVFAEASEDDQHTIDVTKTESYPENTDLLDHWRTEVWLNSVVPLRCGTS